jgi:NAD-specific glutamate dehydrogenase
MILTNLVDILLLNVRILQNLFNRFHRFSEEIHVEFFKLGPRKCLRKVVAVFKRLDLDPGRLLARQRSLSFLNLSLEFAHRPQVLRHLRARLLLILFHEVVNDTVVKIFSSKVSIPSSGQDFKDTIFDREKGHVEGTTSQIVYDDLRFPSLFIQTVGDSSSGGLIDDTENLKTSNRAGILGRLSLSVVEVCVNVSAGFWSIEHRKHTGWDGDHSVCDFFAKVCLSGLLHFCEDHGADFLGCLWNRWI